jgi:hypothetical protein
MVRSRSSSHGTLLRSGHRLHWWAELVFVLGYYALYSTIRNVSNANPAVALHHAKQVIAFERAVALYQEQHLHEWARSIKPLIVTCNYFYGSLHFVVTIGVGIFLFRRRPDDYPLWRNTLAVATGLALIGFHWYELMPPRLLPAHYGFVDTLAKYPTFWSFNSGAMSRLSNQYAAMPSVHCCWALWCACALVPRLQRPWAKALAAAYPVMTVVVIVFTANHYFIDAVGGFVIFGIGYGVARGVTRAGRSDATSSRTTARTV